MDFRIGTANCLFDSEQGDASADANSTPCSTPASPLARDCDVPDSDEPLRHELRAMKRRMRELDKRLQTVEQFCKRHENTLVQLKEYLDKQSFHEAREQNLALRRRVPVPFFSQHHNSTDALLQRPLVNVFPGGLPSTGVVTPHRTTSGSAKSQTLAL